MDDDFLPLLTQAKNLESQTLLVLEIMGTKASARSVVDSFNLAILR